MELFYFSKSPKMLFGIYHPPQSGIIRSVGVILCYPMGQEYIRSHHAFLQLAILLSSAGFHVLRFDYYGCGDSEGDSEQGEISQWVIDINSAVEELKSRCDMKQICLIGLRLGGSLVMLAGAERGDIDGIIIWSPIVMGRKYIEELTILHEKKVESFFIKLKHRLLREKHHEILGFPLTDSMVKDMKTMDLLSLQQKPADNILFIESGEIVENRRIKEHLKGIGANVFYKLIPAPEVWIKHDHRASKGLVPIPILQFMVSWISGIFP